MEILFTAGILALYMAALYVAGRLFTGPKTRSVLIYAALGVGALLTLHALGAGVGVNLHTLAVSAVLGVPGTALIWLISVLG